jgi:hypothetical protein
VPEVEQPIAIARYPSEATLPVLVRFESVEVEMAISSRETFRARHGVRLAAEQKCGSSVSGVPPLWWTPDD